MKRIITLISALVCIVGLVGCSAEDITGTITFYSEATLEKTEPVSDTSFELSNEQVKTIKKIIKNVKEWTDDSVVDRLPFYFDGEIKFTDSEFVYYFCYERNVIYYYHYFAGITAEEMQFIRSMSSQNPS